jgi:hypothetical protein
LCRRHLPPCPSQAGAWSTRHPAAALSACNPPFNACFAMMKA